MKLQQAFGKIRHEPFDLETFIKQFRVFGNRLAVQPHLFECRGLVENDFGAVLVRKPADDRIDLVIGHITGVPALEIGDLLLDQADAAFNRCMRGGVLRGQTRQDLFIDTQRIIQKPHRTAGFGLVHFGFDVQTCLH